MLSAPAGSEDRETALLWHQKIVDSIAAGDTDSAAEAMAFVIHNGMRRYKEAAVETAPAAPAVSGESL